MSRYEVKVNFPDYFIIDNETGDKWLFKQDIADVMNQQDKEIKRLKEKIENISIGEDGIIYNCLIIITDGCFENTDREELADKLNVRKEYIDYLMDYYHSDKFKSFEDYLDHKEVWRH